MTPLIKKVSRALGRQEPLRQAPIPPAPNESISRLFPAGADMAEIFTKVATAAQFKVQRTTEQELLDAVVAFVQSRACKKIGLTNSPILEKLNVLEKLKSAGLDAKSWTELTLDESYDLDCGITDVFAAVAETGSLAIRPTPAHGRALSLVPLTHIAVVESSKLVPDLIDLFDKIAADKSNPNVTIITGPSKTADIEGVLVTGVHGPGLVQVFLLA